MPVDDERERLGRSLLSLCVYEEFFPIGTDVIGPSVDGDGTHLEQRGHLAEGEIFPLLGDLHTYDPVVHREIE